MGDKKEEKKPSFGEKAGNYFLNKIGLRLIITAIMSLIAWYASSKNVTIAQFNVAYASIPLSVILLAMVFDYGLDTGKLYNRMLGRGKNPLSKLAFAIGSVTVFFLLFTWLVAGTVTLNLSLLQPENIVAAGIVALVVLIPNTGTSEWLLWLWIATQIATGGSYLVILPAAIGGVLI